MSVQSMTGFGKACVEEDGVQIDVEVRSVNHRFLDASCRVPNGYSIYERDIVGKVREVLSRGRVDITVVRTDSRKCSYEVKFNEENFRAYWKALQDACSAVKVDSKSIGPDAVLSIMNRREVLEMSPGDVDFSTEKQTLLSAVAEALRGVCEMRVEEGKQLRAEIENLVITFESTIKSISNGSETTVDKFQERLNAKLKKILPDNIEVDASRLAQEVAVLADRVDITEELVRLNSHIEQFRLFLSKSCSGRKLDFLIQEMGREINTCGSKAQNSDVQVFVVEAKALLEKVREQVQNIE